ncbi:STAS domain-containing protein [Tautonia rosea]|uniref:STAS domain-containing protein n=1 Tax=Tautonia rosea TaxID=2728037 RepID=UPI001475B235|nr:STAS domain-containing protein [Tautonia rosea]
MMECARTSAANRADRGPHEVRAQCFGERESDRLVEDWITSRIEGVSRRSGKRSGPDQLPIDSALRRVRNPESLETQRTFRHQGWKRLRIEHRGDVTVVQLLDQRLTHDVPLAELRGELRDLTTAGCLRIVLNLSRVEQVSSQFLEILTTLDRLCSNRPGGRMKLCNVGAEVLRIIDLCGLEEMLEVAPDLHSALSGDWPVAVSPVPVELFDVLSQRSDSPSESRQVIETRPSQADELHAVRSQIYLTVQRDGNVLGTLRIPENGLRIGRDAPCELRLRHPSVSRVHAWIGLRDGQLCLDDLGSSNGTVIGAHRFRSTSVAMMMGGAFSIGPYRLEPSAIGSPVGGQQSPHRVMERNFREETGNGESGGNSETIEGSSSDLDVQTPSCMRIEQIDDVLVLSPTISQFDLDDTIEPLRDCLDWLTRQPNAIVNVVINLAPVASLSGRAIGVLMAYSLKLRRHGGNLRLAQPSPTVLVALEIVGLPTLIETFPSLDEAVLNRWPN